MTEKVKNLLYYMGSSLDLFGVTRGFFGSWQLPDPQDNGFQKDARALRGDWCAVGGDIHTAMVAERHAEEERQEQAE